MLSRCCLMLSSRQKLTGMLRSLVRWICPLDPYLSLYICVHNMICTSMIFHVHENPWKIHENDFHVSTSCLSHDLFLFSPWDVQNSLPERRCENCARPGMAMPQAIVYKDMTFAFFLAHTVCTPPMYRALHKAKHTKSKRIVSFFQQLQKPP